jgi:hypothetical protein
LHGFSKVPDIKDEDKFVEETEYRERFWRIQRVSEPYPDQFDLKDEIAPPAESKYCILLPYEDPIIQSINMKGYSEPERLPEKIHQELKGLFDK